MSSELDHTVESSNSVSPEIVAGVTTSLVTTIHVELRTCSDRLTRHHSFDCVD